MSTLTLTFSNQKTRAYEGSDLSYVVESGCIIIMEAGKTVDTYLICEIDKIS